MVEQSPPTVSGIDGVGAPGPLQGSARSKVDATGGAHLTQRSAAGATSALLDGRSPAWWMRAWLLLRRVLHDRVWPGPWATDAEVEESDDGLRLRRTRARPRCARNLPDTALRSGVLIERLDALAVRAWARSTGLRAGDVLESWEAVGVLGACFLLAGRPSPLVVHVESAMESAMEPDPGARTEFPRGSRGPGRPLTAARDCAGRIARRGAGSRRRPRASQVLGMRWAQEVGFDLTAPAPHDIAESQVDLWLATGVSCPDRDVLHGLACDAAAALRPGGLLVVTVALTEGAAGAAELRAVLADIAEVGFDLVGDLDESAHLIAAARATHDLATHHPAAHDRARLATEPSRIDRRRQDTPARDWRDAPYAYIRLMQRYRGSVT